MSDQIKEIISMFEDLQNEYILLFEKNNIDPIKIKEIKEIQKEKYFKFKIKLLEYKSNSYILNNKKVDLNNWEFELSK
jgi:hypothetical protein